MPHRREKEHTPFPISDEDRVRWLLDNTRVRPLRYNIHSTVSTTEQNATELRAYLLNDYGLISSSGKDRRQIFVQMSILYDEWLETRARHYAIMTSAYHERKKMALVKVHENKTKAVSEKYRLLELLYARDGKRGCYDCGKEDEVLEFSHIDTTVRITKVSTLLSACHWDKAEAEAMKCQVRCISCRRKKIRILRQQPIIATPSAQLKKERARLEKYAERGRTRLLKAKLDAGQCAMCPRKCTLENELYFEFDHTDVSEKDYCMGTTRMRPDAVFYRELAKCRLLCSMCHQEHTRKQREVGDIARLKVEKRGIKRAREASIEPIVDI